MKLHGLDSFAQMNHALAKFALDASTFLLQEMNREANTLLSKTSGLAGEALKITEAGLIMKAEIEKSREQVQNLE